MADVKLREVRVLSKHKHNVDEIGSVAFRGNKSFLEPDFSSPGQFLHNDKFVAVFIPCIAPLFYLAGNILFGVCVVSIVGIHLVGYVSKQRKSMVAAFLFSVVALQFTTVYCLLPYVWKSLFNIGLVFIYNVFLVLSGGFGLLQFKQICMEEPTFAMYLEYILFIAYPITGQFVMTSVGSLFLGWWTAPFFYILCGFWFVQIFLVPSRPSFLCDEFVHKAGQERTNNYVVIGPLEKTLLLFNLLSIPGSMFIVIYFLEFFKLITWVKLLFCGLLSISLCTCLNIHDVVTFLDIHPKTVSNIKWLSGIGSLILLSTILWSCGVISVHVLPLLIGNIGLGLSIAITSNIPERKVLHQISLVILMVFYMALASPLVYNLVNQNVISSLGLISLSILSVASIWLSVTNIKAFNYVVILQSIGLVTAEHLLQAGSVYSVKYSILSCTITIYLIYRLQLANVVPWQTSWLCASIHSSKLSLVILVFVPQPSLQDGLLLPSVLSRYHSLVSLISSLTISKVLFFCNEKSVSNLKGAKLCFAVGLAILAVYDCVILKLWVLLFNHWPSGADIAASLLLLWGLLCLRITMVQLSHNLDAKRVNIVVLCAGVFIELFQPDFNPVKVAWSNAVYLVSLVWPLDVSLEVKIAENIALPWLLMASMITCLVLLVKLSRIENRSIAFYCFVSFLMGFPVGLQVASLLPVDRPPFLSLSYGLASFLVVLMIMSSWIVYQQFPSTHRYSFALLLLCMLFSLSMEPTKEKKNNASEWVLSNLHYYMALYLILGICLKKQSSPAKESLEENKGKLTPLHTALGASVFANMSIIISCVLAVTCTPDQHWELWISLCTFILLLWRPEGLIWIEDYRVPSTLPATLFLLVTMYLGTIVSAFPVRGGIWSGIGFSLEMFFLHSSLPSHLGFVYSLLNKHISLTLQQLAIFCAPANVVLLVYCSTFAGRILGIVGISMTYWVFYYVECPEWKNTSSH